MFDQNENSADSNDSAENDCFNRSTTRKRRRETSGDHITKNQQDQISSFPELAQMPTSTGMQANINSSIAQGIGIENSPIPASGIGLCSSLPSFQSNLRSLREGPVPPSLFTRVPISHTLLGGDNDLVGSATLGQGIYNGSIQPPTTAAITVSDPLQQFLQLSTSGGTGSSSSNTIGVINSQSKGASFGISNSNQYSSLSQQLLQQGGTALSSDPSLPNYDSTPFQLPFDSDLKQKKVFLRNIDKSNSEISTNIQLQQQHMATMSQLNTFSPSNHTMASPEQIAALTRLIGTDTPSEIPSNPMVMSQVRIRNEVIHSSAGVPPAGPTTNPTTTNRKDPVIDSSIFYDCGIGRSKPLFLPCDSRNLSDYQCLLRNQIELFEATDQDLQSSTKGRNKPIFHGQVGVRCIHCRNLKPENRGRGATYYPAKLEAMYQSGQTMAIRHLRNNCMRVPFHIRERLFILKDGKSSAGGGKKYWSDAASVLGVYACEGGGLRFRDEAPAASTVADSIAMMATNTKSQKDNSKRKQNIQGKKVL